MSADRGDIEDLLAKIDKDTQEIHYLKRMLEFEKNNNEKLESKIKAYEKSAAQREHSQSRMLIHQESLVRDMGRELDSISAQLKSRYEEKIDWEKRYNKLKLEFEELAVYLETQEEDMLTMNQRLEEQKAELDKYRAKGEQLLELTRLYDNLKRRFMEDGQQRELADTQVSKKARKIWGHYQNLRTNLAKSESFLKKELSKSQDIVVSYKRRKVGLHREIEQVWSENLFLKQDILSGLKSILDGMRVQNCKCGRPQTDFGGRRGLAKENKWGSPVRSQVSKGVANGGFGTNQGTSKPAEDNSILGGSNVSFSNNMNPPQNQSIRQNTMFNGSLSKKDTVSPPIRAVSAFDSMGSTRQTKHVRSKSMNNQRPMVSPLVSVRENKMRYKRRKNSAWVSEKGMPKSSKDRVVIDHKKINLFKPNTDQAVISPKKPQGAFESGNSKNLKNGYSVERRNKFERTGSLNGTVGGERLDNLNIILSQNQSTQQDFLGETLQQKEKVFEDPDSRNMFTGEFKMTLRENEEKLGFAESKFGTVQKVTSYEVSNPTNRQVPTEIFNSKYLSNPRHPQSVTVANPRVWSPSQKNANSTYLQKEQILSPNKSINEKNKELNQKISRLLEYIRFDQSRRRSLMERDSKGNGRQGFASGNAVAFGFGSNGGFGVRSKIANESINPFRSEIQSSPLEIGKCPNFVFPKSHSSVTILGTKPKRILKQKKLLLAKDRDSLNGIKRKNWAQRFQTKSNNKAKQISYKVNFERNADSSQNFWNRPFEESKNLNVNSAKLPKKEIKKWSWENHPDPGSFQKLGVNLPVSERRAQFDAPNAFLDDNSSSSEKKSDTKDKNAKAKKDEPDKLKNPEIGSFGDDFKPNESDRRTKVGSPIINRNIASVNAYLTSSQRNQTLRSKQSRGENLFTSQSKSNISSKPDNQIANTHQSSMRSGNMVRKTSIEMLTVARSKQMSASFKEMDPDEIERLDKRALELNDVPLNVSQTHFGNESPQIVKQSNQVGGNAFGQENTNNNDFLGVNQAGKNNHNNNFTLRDQKIHGKNFNSFNSDMNLRDVEKKFETIGNLLENAVLKISNKNSKRSMGSFEKSNNFSKKKINGNFFTEEIESPRNPKASKKENTKIEKIFEIESERNEIAETGGFQMTLGEDIKIENKIHSFGMEQIPRNQSQGKEGLSQNKVIITQNKINNKKKPNFFRHNELNASFENLESGDLGKKVEKKDEIQKLEYQKNENDSRKKKTEIINEMKIMNIGFNNSFKNPENQKIEKPESKPHSKKNSKQEANSKSEKSNEKQFDDIFGKNESQLASESEAKDEVPIDLNQIKKTETSIDKRHAEIMKTTIQREISFEMRQVNNQLLEMEQKEVTPEQRRQEALDRITHLKARSNLRSLGQNPMIFKIGKKKDDQIGVELGNQNLMKEPVKYGESGNDQKNVFGIRQGKDCISKSMPGTPDFDNSLGGTGVATGVEKALSVKMEKPPRRLRNKPKSGKTKKKKGQNRLSGSVPKKHSKGIKPKKKRKTAKSANKMNFIEKNKKIIRNSRAKSVSKKNASRRHTAPRKPRNRKRNLKIDLSQTGDVKKSRLNKEEGEGDEFDQIPMSKSPYKYNRNFQEERNKYKLEQLKKQEKLNKEIKEKAKASQKLRKEYMKQWARKENPEHSRRKERKRSKSKQQRRERDLNKSLKKKRGNGLKNLRKYGRGKKPNKTNVSVKSAKSYTEKSERAESLYEAKRRSAKESKLMQKQNEEKAGVEVDGREEGNRFKDDHQLKMGSFRIGQARSSISKPVPLPPFGTNEHLQNLPKVQVSSGEMLSSNEPLEQFFYNNKNTNHKNKNLLNMPTEKRSGTESQSNAAKNIFSNQPNILSQKQNKISIYHKTDPSIKTTGDIEKYRKRATYHHIITSIGDSADQLSQNNDRKGNLIYKIQQGIPMTGLTDSERDLGLIHQKIMESDANEIKNRVFRKYAQSGRSIRKFSKKEEEKALSKDKEMAKKFQHFQKKKRAQKGEIGKKKSFLPKNSKKDSSGNSVRSKDHYKLYRPNRNKQNGITFQSSRFLQTNFRKNQNAAMTKGSVKKKRSGSKKSTYSQKFEKKSKRSKEIVGRKKKRSTYSEKK